MELGLGLRAANPSLQDRAANPFSPLARVQTRVSNLVNKLPTYPEDIRLATELVDEWGRGFVAETDYRYEAANTEAFSAAMERRGLGAVTSPSVVGELSTSCLLTTEWVDGTRPTPTEPYPYP